MSGLGSDSCCTLCCNQLLKSEWLQAHDLIGYQIYSAATGVTDDECVANLQAFVTHMLQCEERSGFWLFDQLNGSKACISGCLWSSTSC